MVLAFYVGPEAFWVVLQILVDSFPDEVVVGSANFPLRFSFKIVVAVPVFGLVICFGLSVGSGFTAAEATSLGGDPWVCCARGAEFGWNMFADDGVNPRPEGCSHFVYG